VPAADLVKLLGISAGARVLDVGAGTGAATRVAARAAEPGGIVVGIDPSVPMLAQARQEGGASYARAVAIDLPFRDGTFGYILANFVVSHFPSYQTALFDMMRVLARGGRMGVTAWGSSEGQDEFTRAWRGLAEDFAEAEILSDVAQRALPWGEHFAQPAWMKDTLHEAGLRDIWVERREYRFEMTAEEYLTGREISSLGRFLRQTLGDELWEVFRQRAREAFSERFPPAFNDFREVVLAVGHKP
jgi:ubiquinone/menaquinone biosynthesis C-methylase UbiE